MRPVRSRAVLLCLLAVALLPMLLAGASVSHTHDGGPGYYDHQHDLTLYAATGAAALSAAATAVTVVLLAAPLVVADLRRVDALARSGADSRAPPLA
jgi:hypothetical protein